MSARASERELREIDDFLRWVRAEETAAFEPVVRRFQRPLRAWLVMRSPPGVDADDVAQQSLVLAFTRLAEFQPGTDFAAWLFTIAAFQLRGEASRLRRVADYHSRYAPEMFAYSLDHRVEQAPGLAEARLDNLRECVQSLAEPLRRFIARRYDEGKIWDGSELCLGTTSVNRHGFPRSRVGLAWGPLFIQARSASKGMRAACTSGAEPHWVNEP